MLPIMICYARSGGTILNKCLGSLENVVMVSEVNPLGGGAGRLRDKSFTTVKLQVQNWYDIELKNKGFKNELVETYHFCQTQNKILILRDWPFVNFTPHELNDFNPPDEFLSLKTLKDELPVVPFAFIRDSIDVWISRECPDPDVFYKYYNKYIDELLKLNIPIFKYEDFCQNPGDSIKKICECTGVPYSDTWKNYMSYDKANGDSQNIHPISDQPIRKMLRRKISIQNVKAIQSCEGMKRCNNLLGYPPTYFNGNTPFTSAKYYCKLYYYQFKSYLSEAKTLLTCFI